ncbi:hypothetical protein QOXRLQWA_CDS0043 [Staphylococcus phage PG-2021_23]
MSKFKRWFKQNVLKKEKTKFKVYFMHNKFNTRVPVIIEVEAKSKAEAKKKILKFIKTHSVDPKNYKFLKVEYK